MRHAELKEEVATVARRLLSSGLVTGTSGNVSARVPGGGVLITPSGLDYSKLGPEEVVLVDLDGELLEGELVPSTETPMHVGIYRARPEVGGIVHTHSRHATALACLGLEIPPVHYMLATLSEEARVPLAPYALYGTEALARGVSDALGNKHGACLLQNHGTITVARGPHEAYSRTEILEEMAGLYYRARLAGEPVLLSADQISEVSAKLAGYGQPKKAT